MWIFRVTSQFINNPASVINNKIKQNYLPPFFAICIPFINLQTVPETEGDAARIAFSIVVILVEDTIAEYKDITANPLPKQRVHPKRFQCGVPLIFLIAHAYYYSSFGIFFLVFLISYN